MTDFAGFTHAFLIRDPARMIASYLRKREAAAFEDFGLERQAEFFEREADRLGKAPPVVDANDVLADPEGTLSALCAALGIPWDPAMLSWPPGRRETDGPWAPHWYQAVEASTGFGPPDPPAALDGEAAASPSAAGLITSGWRRTNRGVELAERPRFHIGWMGRRDSKVRISSWLDRVAAPRRARKKPRRGDGEGGEGIPAEPDEARPPLQAAPVHRSERAPSQTAVLTHMRLAVIGRRAQGLVVADKPDAAPKGVFELNTAVM